MKCPTIGQWFTPRCNCLQIAIVNIAVSVVMLVLNAVEVKKLGIYIQSMSVIRLVYMGLHIAMCLENLISITMNSLLLHGVRKASPALLLPYLIYNSIDLLLLIICCIVLLLNIDQTSFLQFIKLGITTTLLALSLCSVRSFWSDILAEHAEAAPTTPGSPEHGAAEAAHTVHAAAPPHAAAPVRIKVEDLRKKLYEKESKKKNGGFCLAKDIQNHKDFENVDDILKFIGEEDSNTKTSKKNKDQVESSKRRKRKNKKEIKIPTPNVESGKKVDTVDKEADIKKSEKEVKSVTDSKRDYLQDEVQRCKGDEQSEMKDVKKNGEKRKSFAITEIGDLKSNIELDKVDTVDKKRVATPSLQPPAPVQRSSRSSWEETGARRKQRNQISKSPEPQGRRSDSNPGGSGYTVEGMTSGSGYTVEGMSEEEQLALALSQSRLEAPPSAVGVMGELREVVVDGSNVAMHHGNHRVFSVKGISICVDYFTNLGHKVLVMMPRHRRNRASQQEKNVLDALEGSVLFYTPARKTPTNSWTCYDDRFMVEYASQHGAVVLTNDNYRDFKDEPKYKDTIENRILPYMFANDTLMIPDDPMGRDGPKLEKFLRK